MKNDKDLVININGDSDESFEVDPKNIPGFIALGAAFIICISACVITIQCWSVHFLPTLSLAASSSTITGIFLTSMLVYIAIVVGTLFPSLGLVSVESMYEGRKRIAGKYAAILFLTLFALNVTFWGYAWVYVHSQGLWQKLANCILFLIYCVYLYVFAWKLNAMRTQVSESEADLENISDSSFWAKFKSVVRWFRVSPIFVSLTYLPQAFLAVIPLGMVFIIMRPEQISIQNLGAGTAMSALIAGLNWLVIARPNRFGRYAMVSVALFAVVWAWTLSPTVFRLLGLGNRAVKIAMIDAKYRSLLIEAGFTVPPLSDKEKDGEKLIMKDFWLSLRIGDQVLIAKDAGEAKLGHHLVLPTSSVLGLILEVPDYKPQTSTKP
ncbi:MAG: hypothetical protein QM790_19625 [Nibricoccus sp.]